MNDEQFLEIEGRLFINDDTRSAFFWELRISTLEVFHSLAAGKEYTKPTEEEKQRWLDEHKDRVLF